MKKKLASLLEVKFLGCGNKHEFVTSPKLQTNNSMKDDIIVRAVWGRGDRKRCIPLKRDDGDNGCPKSL